MDYEAFARRVLEHVRTFVQPALDAQAADISALLRRIESLEQRVAAMDAQMLDAEVAVREELNGAAR